MNVIAKYSTAPITNPAPAQPDRRREKRRRVLGVVKILVGGSNQSAFDCTIINRSHHGLRLQVGAAHAIPKAFIVEFPNGTRRHARLAWASSAELGLEYDTTAP